MITYSKIIKRNLHLLFFSVFMLITKTQATTSTKLDKFIGRNKNTSVKIFENALLEKMRRGEKKGFFVEKSYFDVDGEKK